MRKIAFLSAASLLLLIACNDSGNPGSGSIPEPATSNEPPVLSYTVVNASPHDTSSYTEGFFMADGKLYESSGAPQDEPRARSIFGVVNPASGKIDVKAELDRKTFFGEGITLLNGKFYQLTWTNKVGFVYDAKTFKRIGQFGIPGAEGWGMTTDGSSLILSDGSSNLTWLDPVTFRTLRITGVTDNNGPVGNLNELEYVNGKIYANVYETTKVVQIDASSGKVTGRLDFAQLDRQEKDKHPSAEYMNGIAYDSAKKLLLITGKFWPSIYQVRLN